MEQMTNDNMNDRFNAQKSSQGEKTDLDHVNNDSSTESESDDESDSEEDSDESKEKIPGQK